MNHKFGILKSDVDMLACDLWTCLFEPNVHLHKSSLLAKDTLIEQIGDNLPDLDWVWVNTLRHLLINLKGHLNIFAFDVGLGCLDDLREAFVHVYLFDVWVELVLWDVINLLEVFDPVLNALKNLNRFIKVLRSDWLNICIQFLQFPKGKVSHFMHLGHQMISEFGHFFLGLHNLFIHYNGSYISDNEKFVVSTSDLHVDLVERYELLNVDGVTWFILLLGL